VGAAVIDRFFFMPDTAFQAGGAESAPVPDTLLDASVL
jgi:hypothetical protein